MSYDILIERALKQILEFVKSEIQKELAEQGHRATGKLIDSIEIRIEKISGNYRGSIYIEDYGFILDKGVAANKVPYNPNSGAKSSRYIEALKKWIAVVKPGLSERNRTSFAFAIAKTAKKEGHPTRGSYAFSKNSRRKEWAKYAIDKNEKKIEGMLNLGQSIAALVDNFVTNYQKIVK